MGAWTISAKPENATIPIWVDDPWLWMKLAAAVSAASIRLGGTSVEHMLPETSMARTIVVSFVGTLAITTGRATATAKAGQGQLRTARTAGGGGRNDELGSASRIRIRLE